WTGARPRTYRRAELDLGQARPVDLRRSRARSAALVLHRAHAGPTRGARRDRPDRWAGAREVGRVGLPPWSRGIQHPVRRADSRRGERYHTKLEARPHRQALQPQQAERVLQEDARAGRLDPVAVDAVLTAAGRPRRPRVAGPAGLTARELEVLMLLARGASNRHIAR